MGEFYYGPAQRIMTSAGNGIVQLKKAEKEEFYKKAVDAIQEKLKALPPGIIVPRMATVSAVLKDIMPHYLWCGFYFAEENEMVIGPYQGKCAYPAIAYTGVCGTSARKKESVIVPNVHAFPGHIMCDERAKSEIVVPLIGKTGHIIGVFDVDSAELNAFDEVDKKHLESLMPLLLEGEIL